MAERELLFKKLGELDVNDPFFDSLKSDYDGFAAWFTRKAEEFAYVLEDKDDHSVQGMLYLKVEDGAVADVTPPLAEARWLKVGTLKINAAGTKAGERVIKKAFDTAIRENCTGLYVTVFPRHQELVSLLTKYGFEKAAEKPTANGVEDVYVKDLTGDKMNLYLNYPRFRVSGRKFWLLAIYPEYHTNLFPDSKLITDPIDIVADVSFTNTIEKVYVGRVALSRMRPGDLVVMYRTTDRPGQAYYRSVATSVCAVVESKRRKDFGSEQAFIEYCRKHSVFDEAELRQSYRSSARTSTVKILYNAAFSRRVIRKKLLEELQISDLPRWDLREISEEQLRGLLELGEVDESLVIN